MATKRRSTSSRTKRSTAQAASRRARAASRARVPPTDPQYADPYGISRFIPAELHLSEDEMLCLSTAWGCIRILVDTLASLEWRVFIRDARGRRTEQIDDNVAWMFNLRPNPDATAQCLKEIALTQMLVDGRAYNLVDYDLAARPARLWNLDPDFVSVLRDRETLDLVYRYRHPDVGTITDLAPWEVLHFRGPCLRDLVGESTLYRAGKAVANGVAAERYATSYYVNGAEPGVLLKPPATSTRAADPADDDRLREEWKKRHGHARGKGRSLAVLNPGWEVEILETDAQKSQVVPSRQFSVEDVARFFGVPLVLLGVQAAAQGYGTNVAQLYQVFARNTLRPWCNRLTQEAQWKLYPQRSPWKQIEIDLSPLMRGDELQAAQADEIALRSGKLTINEARARDGRNALPGGDTPLVASGLTPLERILEPPKPPPAPARPALPSPDEEPAPDGEDPIPSPAPDARALPAAGPVALAAVALDRYGRRIAARRADLERHAPEQLDSNLRALRARHLPNLVADLAGAGMTAENAAAAAIAVESGEPPHLAAERLLCSP